MRYIAFLRGVFPSNAPNVKLRTLFEGLGLEHVQTIGSSGNVLFTSSVADTVKLETEVEQALYELLGAGAFAVVRSADQMTALANSAPFGTRRHSRTTYLAVTFFKQLPTTLVANSNSMIDLQSSTLCTVNDNTIKPHFMAKIMKEYGKQNTTRTWNVVLKIANKLSES